MQIYATEEEQLEALQLWWVRWRYALLGALAAVLLAGGGYTGWQARQTSQLQQAYQSYSAIEQSLTIVAEVQELQRQQKLEALVESEQQQGERQQSAAEAPDAAAGEHREAAALEQAVADSKALLDAQSSSGYAWLAGLQTASMASNSELPQAQQSALDLLASVVEASGGLFFGDDVFNGVARLRYALLLDKSGDAAAALAALDHDSARAYGPVYHNIRGDLLARLDRLDEARIAWQSAKSEDLPPLMSALLDVKINNWSLLTEQPAADTAADREAGPPQEQ